MGFLTRTFVNTKEAGKPETRPPDMKNLFGGPNAKYYHGERVKGEVPGPWDSEHVKPRSS